MSFGRLVVPRILAEICAILGNWRMKNEIAFHFS